MELIDVLTAQLEEQKRSIQARQVNGWKEKDLNTYKAGVANSYGDLIENLRNENLIFDEEWDKLNEIIESIVEPLYR